jgi:hypothetical protein
MVVAAFLGVLGVLFLVTLVVSFYLFERNLV